jgi:hypothetical protein
VKLNWLALSVRATLTVGLVGGWLLFIEYFVDLPRPLLAAAWLAFLVSVAAAFPLAVVNARRGGASLPKAVARGTRDGLKWFFDLLP